MPVEYLQEILVFRLSEFEKAQLIEEVTETEIERTLFTMPNDKSPRSDGYTSELFKVSWAVLWKDIVAAVKSFYCVKGFLPKGLNDSSSHTEEGQSSRDERLPTNLRLQYKVISKINTNI